MTVCVWQKHFLFVCAIMFALYNQQLVLSGRKDAPIALFLTGKKSKRVP